MRLVDDAHALLTEFLENLKLQNCYTLHGRRIGMSYEIAGANLARCCRGLKGKIGNETGRRAQKTRPPAKGNCARQSI